MSIGCTCTHGGGGHVSACPLFVSPSIKLEAHAGCGGIAVSVPSGSVNGGTVLFCLKCMEDRERRLTRERGEAEREVVRRICEWLRTLPAMQHPQAIADAIERGDWRKP